MRIGIITFHGAHNYGSMLQNYALQKVLKDMGHMPVTINYRPQVQKEMYNPFMPLLQLHDKKRILLSFILLPYKKNLEKKYHNFEKFLTDNLALTDEYNKSLAFLPVFDAYISGSDQIWNLNTKEFDWKYFLDFVPDKPIKISYAASLGPSPSFVNYLDESKRIKLNELISRLDGVSVRDIDSANALSGFSGINDVEVSLDPTLLLSEETWYSIIPQKRLVEEEYIFLYNPFYDKSVYEAAKVLSHEKKLPVYVSNLNMRSVMHSLSFKKKIDAGPIEFLNLIKNARYVIGRSFHLVAFSVIFQKKFIAINGLTDSRIKQLLNSLKLEICSTTPTRDVFDVLKELDCMTFEESQDKLIDMRASSLEYLQNKLDYRI